MKGLLRLLEELKKVDLETWKDIRFQLIKIFDVNELDDIKLQTPWRENAYIDIIQGGIQRAIAKQELQFRIGTDPYKEGRPYAEIFAVSESHISDEIFESQWSIVWENSIALALLTAYIAAVQA